MEVGPAPGHMAGTWQGLDVSTPPARTSGRTLSLESCSPQCP